MRRFCLFNLMLALSLSVLSVFVSCNTEDVDYKGAKLSVSMPTPPRVGSAGGSTEFTIESNRPWTIEIPTSDVSWISVDPQAGDGNTKVTVTLLSNGGEERSSNLKVKTTSAHEYVKIAQSGEVATSLLLNLTFGTELGTTEPSTKWPFIDAYKGDLGISGDGSSGVVVSGSGTTLRGNGKPSDQPGASAGTHAFMGKTGSVTIDKIATGGATNFSLSFGVTRYVFDTKDNTFKPEFMTLSVSTDGTNYTPATFQYTPFEANKFWGICRATFSVTAGSQELYVKFTNADTESGDSRIDDVVVKVIGDIAPPTEVAVATGAATAVTETGATLSGSYVGPQEAVITELGVEYKTGVGAYQAVAAPSAIVTPFAVAVTDLVKDTEYTYRAYAKVTDKGTIYGAEKTFRTEGAVKTYITVAQLRAKGVGTISENLFMKASLVSNPTGGNAVSLKNVVLSDGTAGIAVRLAENAAATYKVGDEMEIDLNGAVLSIYQNGPLQIESLLNAKMVPTGQNKPVAVKSISITDLMAGTYESMYVSVSDVQVINDDLGKTMATATAHVSINIEAQAGESFIMFSAKYSAFKEDVVPQGSGVLMGIASVNGGKIQICPQTSVDYAAMTGARFGAPPVLTYSAALEGTMRVGTAFAAANKVVLSYKGATVGEAYSVSMAVTGVGAQGITPTVTASGTFGGIVGDIELALTGTPTTEGEVVFTITGAGSTQIVVNGTVSPAGSAGDPVYTSNVTLPTGTNSGDANYGEKIVLDGTEFSCLKLGTSSKVGKYTTPALPATGDLTLSLYGVTWAAKTVTLKVTVNGGGTINGGATAEIAPQANAGASGSAPYKNIVLTATDLYTFKLEGITAASTLTFETVKGSDSRAILVGVNVK